MKTKLTNRLLMTMVIAVALSVLFAVSSLAAITGGFGVIEGLEDGKNYEAASVTINAEGTGKAIDEANAFDLDANSNKDLAGLYVVREKGETTWSDIIYVYGKYEARSAMHELYDTYNQDSSVNKTNVLKIAPSGSNNSFVSGAISSTKGLYNKTVVNMDIAGKAYGLTVETHFNWDTLKDFYNATTPDEKLAGFNKIKDVAKSIVYRYALTNEEIVPISEANKYTFGFNKGSNLGGINGFTYTNNTVRFEAYVMDNSGSISTYTYDFAGIKFAFNNPSTLAVDFTEDTGWSSALPDEGYLVGFAMYPYYGFDNPDNLTVTINTSKNYTSDKTRTIFYYYYNDYSVDFPKAEAPTGITFEDGKFKGLDASKTYFIAPYTILGADTDKAIPVSGATEYELTSTQTGLWGIGFAGIEGYATASDAGALAYNYPKVEDRKALYELSGTNIATTPKTNEFILGKITGNDDGLYGSATGFQTETGFGSANTKSLYNAGAAQARTEFLEGKKSYIQGYTYGYGFLPKEIVPIKDVKKYSYQFLGQMLHNSVKLTYTNNTMRFDAYVMGLDGEIEIYTYLDTGKTLESGTTTTSTVDFTTTTGWEKPLPEDGYLVGIRLYPLYGMLNGENVTFGSGTIHASEKFRFKFTIGEYEIDVPSHETPTGITFVDGTFKGLDEELTYALTPYGIGGADETKAITFTGKTEYPLDPTTQVGLWSINIAGDDYYQASAPAVFDEDGTMLVYNKPTISDKQELGAYWEEGDTYPDGTALPTKAIGKLKTNLKTDYSWRPEHYSGNGGWYTAEWTGNVVGCDENVSAARAKAFLEAEDDTAKKEAFEKIANSVNGIYIQYAYANNEILPIADVNSFTFGLKREQGTFTYNDNVVKFVAYVMNTKGEVEEYTYIFAPKTLDGNMKDYTVNFETTDGWETALPTEGYYVGYRIYPYYGFNDYTKFGATEYPHSQRVVFQFRKTYSFDIPRFAKPEGITVDENGVVTGLDPNTLYGVAPYTFYGMDYDNMSAIWDGEYTFDLETQKGLWAIIVRGDDVYIGDSDPFLVYNKSPDRKDIGKKAEGKEYLDYVNLGGKAAPEDGIWAEEKLSFYRIYTPKYTSEYSEYLCGDLSGVNVNREVDLEKAIAENDTDKISSIRDTKIEAYQASSFMHYIYAADEIIPIQDLFELKFGIKYQNGQSKFTATHHVKLYVMDVDGKVSEYLYVGPTYDFSTNTSEMHTVTVDVQSIEGLPTEGWVVGFRYEPFGEIDKDTIVPRSSPAVNGAHGLYFYFYTPDYKIKEDAPKPDIKSFPVIAGGYGEISGLNPDLLHEYIYSADQGATWTKWEDGEVPADVTAFKVTEGGIYRVRVKTTDRYYGSDYDEEEVGVYTEADGEALVSEVVKMHLPNDFVQLSAEYEMDLTVKNWVSSLALENIKTVAPDSVITLAGKDYKFVVTASKIATDKKVHYYNMAVSLDGESRYNTLHDKFVEMAGKEYVTDVYFESSSKLPFEEAQVMIELGAANDGADVELRSYNERIDKLRKVEEGTVYDGWVTFNNFEETYVIIKK